MSRSEARAKVSVVIPTYNRRDLLSRTLHQLTRQDMPAAEFEVIVSDDGSSDGSQAVAESFSDRLRMKYTFQPDLGYRAGAARNSGARLATAPVLAFLDTGCLAGPGFLRHHLAGHGDDAIHHAVMGPAYGYNPGEPVPGLAEALDQFPPEEVIARFEGDPVFQDFRYPALLECDFDPNRRAIPWNLFFSSNFSVRADDFWAVGGYDERFHGFGFEDLELGFRLFRRGMPFLDTQDAWIIEWPHERDMEANYKEALINQDRFLEKYQEPVVEIGWMATAKGNYWTCEDDYRELTAWSREVSGMNVAGELAAARQLISADDRIAVIGSGGSIPASLAGAIVVDFDREMLDHALAAGRNHGHHAIGGRTPLADQSVDTVIITSRLAGLWPQWGEELLAEASRIGRRVVTFADLADARPQAAG